MVIRFSFTCVPQGMACAAILFVSTNLAQAHTVVGDRVFPLTLTIDDPGVADELVLPAFSYMPGGRNPDGSGAPSSYSLGFDYMKTITEYMAVSVGSRGYTWQRDPGAYGWANIETELKLVFYENPEHEFMLSGAASFEWGGSGSPSSASLPSDPTTRITPKAFIGKGFGDVPVSWLRPLGVTGEADYSVPTAAVDSITFNQVPSFLTYGATLQYSLLYMNSHVSPLPAVLSQLVPAFEVQFKTPVANIGPSIPGQWVHETTGVVGPSLYYIGAFYQLALMAQLPVNDASGRHVGVLASAVFSLEDLAPTTLGRPLFGGEHEHAHGE